MSQYRNFIETLKNIGLSSTEARDLISKNEYFYHIAHYKKLINNNKFGGAKTNTIKYKDKNYIFYKTNDNDRIIYTLNSQNKGIHNCIVIFINLNNKTVYIETIGNNKGCVILGKVEKGGGRKLITMALKLVTKIKDKYKLKYVYLTDNATKTFFDNDGMSHNIKLSNLTFLTKYNTYYEKHGFIPIFEDQGMVSIDQDIIQNYLKLKKNIKKISIYDIKINFKEFYTRINKKYHYLIDNIKKTKENKKTQKVKLYKFVSYYTNKKEYIPIIHELIIRIFNGNNINIPTKWGIKL